MEGKKTPLFQTHIAARGRIVEFGGWLLPVQYTSVLKEHKAVREAAGLFDVSHMGEIWAEGAGALDFLQELLTNDMSGMVDGQARYSPMCYPDGGTVDDLLVYKFSPERYMIVVNAANTMKDWKWMNAHLGEHQCTLTDRSYDTAQIALQGPLSVKILISLTDYPVDKLAYYYFAPSVKVAGIECVVSRTGYTGEDGFELYCSPDEVARLWEAIMLAGKDDGIVPAGLGCRDTLRFEAGMPLYGHELTAEVSPLMAGLGMFVKTGKEADFVGKAALTQQRAEGVKRKLVGIEMLGRGIARAGFNVRIAGKTIGYITTGSPAPTVGKNLGLALIEPAYAAVGTEVCVEVRSKEIPARVIAKPFYKRG